MAESKYTEQIADKICERIATSSDSTKTILAEVGINYATHMRWIQKYDEYREKYARAKEDQADLLAEEILSIADDSSQDADVDEHGNRTLNNEFVQRSRIRIDARKWLAGKLRPKKYSDKIDVTTDGEKITDTKEFIIQIVGDNEKDGE